MYVVKLPPAFGFSSAVLAVSQHVENKILVNIRIATLPDSLIQLLTLPSHGADQVPVAFSVARFTGIFDKICTFVHS